jgi:hypothetical protein
MASSTTSNVAYADADKRRPRAATGGTTLTPFVCDVFAQLMYDLPFDIQILILNAMFRTGRPMLTWSIEASIAAWVKETPVRYRFNPATAFAN